MGHGGIEDVAGLTVEYPLRLSSAARRVEDEEWVFAVQRFWRTDGRLTRHRLREDRKTDISNTASLLQGMLIE